MSRKKEKGECINCVTPWGLRPRKSSQYNVLGVLEPEAFLVYGCRHRLHRPFLISQVKSA
eukprot:scaffold31303_cov157-Isochrysis_galbana.AAC.1